MSNRLPRLRPTLLERGIALVSPAAATRHMAQRMRYEALTGSGGGYVGGRSDRRAMSGWKVYTESPDAALLPDLERLRNRSYNLIRNTPIATGAIGRAETHIVGSGLRPVPSIDREVVGLDEETAAARERQIEREFKVWATSRNADAARRLRFNGLQTVGLREVLSAGDVFVVKRYIPRSDSPYRLAFQLFAGAQVSNPNYAPEGSRTDGGNRVVGGVELDGNGAPVAIHVQDVHPGNVEGRASSQWRRVPIYAPSGRRQVWHLYKQKLAGQTRGEPFLAPVIEQLKQLGTYGEAELFAAVIGAMFTVTYKSETNNPLPQVQPTEETAASSADEDLKLAPGVIAQLGQGDSVDVPTVGRPNSAFDPFFTAIVRQIGAALEIPYEVLIMHFAASYSASRAALEMAWQFFMSWRAWLAEEFCHDAYACWMEEAVALGRFDAPGFEDPLIRAAWLRALWIGPKRLTIDPEKENRADGIAEDRGWVSATQNAASRGNDFERVHAQRIKETDMRRRDGVTAEAPAAAGAPAPPPRPARRDDQDEPEEETTDD